jgi:holo-[acyl-carrier protein] synthase
MNPSGTAAHGTVTRGRIGAMSRLRVGIDLVQVSRIAGSIEAFGDRFLRRIFTDREVAYASEAPLLMAERLAARFAAKEAAKKAFELEGIGWTEIEVSRTANGSCDLVLHGAARAAVDALGAYDVALSMSHEGDHATAVVVASVERHE